MSDWIVQNFVFPGGCQIVYYDPVTGQALPPQIYQPPQVYQQPAASEQLGMPRLDYYGPAVGIQEPEPAFLLVNKFEQPVLPAPGFVEELDSANEELDFEEGFDSVDEDMDSDEDEGLGPAENMFHYEVFQHEVYQQPVMPVAPVAPVVPVEPIIPVVPMMPIEYIEPVMPNIPAMPIEYIMPAIHAATAIQIHHYVLEHNIQEQPVARRPQQPQPKNNFPWASKAAKSQA
ncbi:hypothetical protein SMACR_09362 [Sordaria macrospora]|uniref:WGS project CABT00000000 data, contig 2.41 n=2 Tax=Sordaria macrospora TaxID=5147 RepID=F7W7Z2_SORMK|nr:uncharacterized protein SMAC_09362 [Sordaria macrospora k-hell]KAA8623949.1 hypothetical protein SMACR_09362 [Sordaria macrospora]WPJ64114.1 hypothetical protein SMAC4_09362 [Sordaria macrospora]CCC13635.1 unnamed protein product [Sordaria macrospora k-hell]